MQNIYLISICTQNTLKNSQNNLKKFKQMKDLDTYFARDDIKMVNNHRKKCLTSLVIEKMQNEQNVTTLTPITTAKILKPDKTKY